MEYEETMENYPGCYEDPLKCMGVFSRLLKNIPGINDIFS
jgi:hypothetical protein